MRINNKFINVRKIKRLSMEIIRCIHAWQTTVLLTLLLLAPVSLSAETIRMAWFTVPPHISVAEDGVTPTGPSILLFESIAARMGCTVEWVGPIPLNRLGTLQKSRDMNLDGAILHVKTEANTPYLYYPSQPYFIGIPSLAVRADNPLNKIRSIEDIKGYRIGFVKTSSLKYAPIIEDNRDKVIIDDLTGENWTSRNLAKVLTHHLDAAYERNQYTLAFQAAIENISDKIKILPLSDYPMPHYYVFQKNSPKGADLLRRYEQAITGWTFDYDAMVKAEIKRLTAKLSSTGK
jgi:ABC-type amino acid transport substrate-binding protein